MKTILITIILTGISLTALGQDKTADELKNLSDNQQYDKIIEQYASKYKDYSARSIYYIGQAYYMKGDDKNCIKFMDISIKKDPKDPAPLYIKASTLNYMQKYNEALNNFEKAISLIPDDALFYEGLGDSYYNLEKYNLAIESYKKYTELNNPSDRSYYMIAQSYSDLNDSKNSLEAFYNAKSKISNESDYYINTLFNIGLLESLNGNYDNAEPVFIELIQIDPNDFHTYAKLIQIYYHRKEYDKAIPLKEKLYEAYLKGLLTDNMKDMYCFDQFKWKDKLVQAFERFEEGDKKEIYNKQLFYVVNQKEEIEIRIQTEYSPVSIALGGPKYLLCASKENVHFNSGIGFNDDFKYEDLKQAVIKMIESHLE